MGRPYGEFALDSTHCAHCDLGGRAGNKGTNLTAKGRENTMLKQIEICGQRFALYSPDKGRTWTSSSRSIVAYRRREKMACLELQKRFKLIGDIEDPDPDNYSGLDILKSHIGR